MTFSLQIPQGQHSLLLGMTGSGKTTLARRLLSSRPYVIVVDTKHELSWPGFTITNSVRAALAGTHTIYRPRNQTELISLLRYVYQAGGWDLYIDEIYTLGRGHVSSYPQEYISLLTRGRSRHITVWTGSQRPRFLPLFCFTEARHLFLLELGSENDTKHVAQMAGVPMLARQQLSGHDYIYYRRQGKICIRSRLKSTDVKDIPSPSNESRSIPEMLFGSKGRTRP